ncbi:MAG: prolyl oligopeptidase family serine peptidase [Alistipes sp.]|nr:prolyl oligopeptidase family serine peptidase [Alistipes sp.]
MKKIIALFVTLVLCYTASAGTNKMNQTIEDQGLTRRYHLYIPNDLPDGAPLVFILHGYGGSAESYFNSGTIANFKTLADENKMLLCYPQASVDPKSKNGWNVYYPWQINAMKVDDCEFICNLAKHLQTTYKVSDKNVFLTGMSNGGEMCYLLAYRKPNEFAAIASMAGLTLIEMADRHNYESPVAFMEVHGTGDMTSRWEGDATNQYGWGAYLPVPVAVGAVAAANKCVYEQTTELPQVKNRVILHRYYGAPSGKEVHFYEVRNGGHNWATDSFDSCNVIIEFFKKNMVK